MGQFSWFCQDTGERIVVGETKTVYMTDNRGNSWKEDCYEGYGVFGGKDFYELLAEMNGKGSDRIAGIDLEFAVSLDGMNPNIIYPSLTRSKEWPYDGRPPRIDPDQGFP